MHLDEVEAQLEHGDPLKFALWSLDRDASFFASSGPAPKVLEDLANPHPHPHPNRQRLPGGALPGGERA